MTQQAIPIKMVIVGDACVGKTCVLISYTEDRFPTQYVPTVFQNYAATVKVDNTNVNLGLWDTAGQEEYDRLRPLAYSNCDIFLITFSVIDTVSFNNAINRWYPELSQYAPGVLKIFIGNKCDLRQEYKKKNSKEKTVEKETAKKRIEELGCRYFECSALTREGLKQIFQQGMREIIKHKVNRNSKKESDKKSSSKCFLI